MSKPASGFAAPLGASLGDVVSPTLAARGLGEASLVSHWPEIVGNAIAGYARPIQLQWPPRGAKRDPDEPIAPATLLLRIDGAFALEATHAAATIVARVNAHLGWRCVAKLAFRQGPLPAIPKARPRPAPPSAQALARAREIGAGIADEELREAVARLGARVIDKARREGVTCMAPAPLSSKATLAGRRVSRMNGAGNKILVLDLRDCARLPTPEEARAIHRAPGLDYDQLMVLSEPRRAETLAFVSIYNNDGGLAGACGNGTRCVADRLARETGDEAFAVETAAGVIACERLGPWTYRVDMGAPRLAWDEIPLARPVADTSRVEIALPGAPDSGPASVVNMGNPHAVFFVTDVAAVDLEKLGPRYETHPLFPEKANVSFAQVLSREQIALRVWERGVGATLACGSAACATLVSAARLGLTERSARVDLPGGELVIAWRESDGHVLMTGPVEFEREVELEAVFFAARP